MTRPVCIVTALTHLAICVRTMCIALCSHPPTPFPRMRTQGVSNIVFSNGGLDPWSGGGVTTNITGSPSVVAIVIPQVCFVPQALLRPCLCSHCALFLFVRDDASFTDAHGLVPLFPVPFVRLARVPITWT